MGVFLAQKSESILDGMVELFCVEKMPIFSVEFHFLLQYPGLIIHFFFLFQTIFFLEHDKLNFEKQNSFPLNAEIAL